MATAFFMTTTPKAEEVRVMLGWTDKFGVSAHVCKRNDIFNVKLRHLSRSRLKRKLELVSVAVGVETQHEQCTGALYKVLYKVTVVGDWN